MSKTSGAGSKAQQQAFLEQKKKDIEKYTDAIFYSARYSDDEFEYRHVILPKALVKYLPVDRLAEEDEWRGIGIRQSPGWENYLRHAPEPHILMFKREKDYQTKSVPFSFPYDPSAILMLLPLSHRYPA